LGELVKSREREEAAELETMHRRYRQAAPARRCEGRKSQRMLSGSAASSRGVATSSIKKGPT